MMNFDRNKYVIKANESSQSFQSGTSINELRVLLGANEQRFGFIIYNESTNSIYVSFDNKAATERSYSVQIGDNTEWSPPEFMRDFTGVITWNPASQGDGKIRITEFVLKKRRRPLTEE